MGIKHFFAWYRKNMPENIHNIRGNQTVEDFNIKIDNLLLDLNGLFHNSAQKVFKYGSHAPPKRLLGSTSHRYLINNSETRKRVYSDVCETIDKIISISRPKKRVIMCTDGTAPRGKQNQQRQRRFRAAHDSGDKSPVFDSNCITPGTVFMHEMSEYIDRYIKLRKKTSKKWSKLSIQFSNEKVPGEGEHKAVDFVRKHGSESESYCINGPDADLFMLALATQKPNFYILREDMYNAGNFFLIDILKTRNSLVEKMRWVNKNGEKFIEKNAINDFIFMCFTVGNDFLPHVPSIEIIEEGIEMMISIYKDTCEGEGHMTRISSNGNVIFVGNVLKLFMEKIGSLEEYNYKRKLSRKVSFQPDKLMLQNSHKDINGWYVDVEKYTTDYNEKHFGTNDEKSMETVCHQYLQGLQWVISYYTVGCPSWHWFYQYQYAPSASVIAKHVNTYKHVRYGKTKPCSAFEQLISVLPPKSAHLIPEPLRNALLDKDSEMLQFCPEVIEIDYDGKKAEWEGITILPTVDQNVLQAVYKKYSKDIEEKHSALNMLDTEKMY